MKGYPESSGPMCGDPTSRIFLPSQNAEIEELLSKTSKASGHQIVWFGDPKLTYPKKAILDLSNGV